MSSATPAIYLTGAVLTWLIAIAFTLPLFLFFRERARAQA